MIKMKHLLIIFVFITSLDRQIGATLKFKLLKKFLDFQKSLATDCHLPERIVDIPVRIHYEYGDDTEPYSVFMTPGVLLT